MRMNAVLCNKRIMNHMVLSATDAPVGYLLPHGYMSRSYCKKAISHLLYRAGGLPAFAP